MILHPKASFVPFFPRHFTAKVIAQATSLDELNLRLSKYIKQAYLLFRQSNGDGGLKIESQGPNCTKLLIINVSCRGKTISQSIRTCSGVENGIYKPNIKEELR